MSTGRYGVTMKRPFDDPFEYVKPLHCPYMEDCDRTVFHHPGMFINFMVMKVDGFGWKMNRYLEDIIEKKKRSPSVFDIEMWKYENILFGRFRIYWSDMMGKFFYYEKDMDIILYSDMRASQIKDLREIVVWKLDEIDEDFPFTYKYGGCY
jgi:hypothetical protein